MLFARPFDLIRLLLLSTGLLPRTTYFPRHSQLQTAMRRFITKFRANREPVLTEMYRIRKSQGINLSLLEVNTDKLLWDPDAGGFQGCTDWRFAITEMKALLFNTLVRNFEFELGDPKEELMVFKSVQGGIDASHILEL
ncbi:uncharacterized protein C8R40DRAFT_1066287 [Lentinula edodes]|uniref:uncharacterized protein n=1 Tax=Lentinula edodes TaxID=5353 RepID=UPI001E8E9207|nr:uncharacterized protein C8R40DRAFT_1066287 [Lentinula edodes]KAH7879161.1 hypothetical protein C8R40DRAFT_1066287 [Lentinula edodes]